MDNRAFVSVIIPTYNRQHTLKRCIDSVLNQTYRNFEIIIVDDCSTDGTMEFVETEYGAITEINIVYVRNDDNLGASASRNVGVSYAAGEYIAFHDSDDEWYPDKLEKQMNCFVACNQETGAVYSLFYTNGVGSAVYPPENVAAVYKSGHVFYTLLLNSLVGMITLVMRKSIFVEVGGFNEQLHSLEDYELTIRIARKYGIMLVDEVLATAYESENSVGKRNKDKIVTQCYIMNLYREELEHSGLKRRKFEMVYHEAYGYRCEEFFCKCIMQLSKDPDYLMYVQEKWDKLHPSSHPERIQTVDISGITSCTGCMVCQNVCPVGAISQGYDVEGFLIPVIDRVICIRCGRCKEACPVCKENPGVGLPNECYAVMSCDEIRAYSSSGGVFKVLADRILAEGGSVCGAVWNDDWQAEHIVSDQTEDVERMMSSKYVQSNMGNTYQQVKELLEQGKKVLYAGCACQVAGMQCYLGKEYENLLLADVVCHGVPSQKIFDVHLGEGKKEIAEISFRKKEVFGWDTGLFLRYKDGTEYVGNKKDPYIFGLLGNWFLRKSCYTCKFKNKKYSDLTLGDFWKINTIYQFDDGLGTSFVTLNTTKGACFFKSILPQFQKIINLRTEEAENLNPCISKPVTEPKCRELFFDEWRRNKHSTLADTVRAVRKRIHFDIALACIWDANYGSVLTNYALHAFLEAQGKKIVVLDNDSVLRPVYQYKKFAQQHYALSSDFFPDYDYEMLNECCDIFVADDRKKEAYAEFFGECFGRSIGWNRKRTISWVLDPVFLLDQKDYEVLFSRTQMKEREPYIAVYFLDPTTEKRELCLQIQQLVGRIKTVNIMDASVGTVDSIRVLEYDNIKTELGVDEWLAYLRHADFIITDSHYGMYFSVIFKRNFVVVNNRKSEIFNTFMQYPELCGRIIEENARWDVAELENAIDYESVHKRLHAEIDKLRQLVLENIL